MRSHSPTGAEVVGGGWRSWRWRWGSSQGPLVPCPPCQARFLKTTKFLLGHQSTSMEKQRPRAQRASCRRKCTLDLDPGRVSGTRGLERVFFFFHKCKD